MPAKKYIVRLDPEERNQLNKLVKTGKAAAYKRQRAQILLKADIGERQALRLKITKLQNSLEWGIEPWKEPASVLSS